MCICIYVYIYAHVLLSFFLPLVSSAFLPGFPPSLCPSVLSLHMLCCVTVHDNYAYARQSGIQATGSFKCGGVLAFVGISLHCIR